MKERPILFSGAMVRAILEGRKTQTRRVCKIAYHAGEWADAVHPARDGMPVFWWNGPKGEVITGRAEFTQQAYETGAVYPYGQPGDRLWVRETWATVESEAPAADMPPSVGAVYRASYDEQRDGRFLPGLTWRPSIFMPRWASRITLEVVGMRCERVNEISEADAQAEGADQEFRTVVYSPDGVKDYHIPTSHRGGFANLWDEINAKRGYSWDSNPWVWVVEFKRI